MGDIKKFRIKQDEEKKKQLIPDLWTVQQTMRRIKIAHLLTGGSQRR